MNNVKIFLAIFIFLLPFNVESYSTDWVKEDEYKVRSFISSYENSLVEGGIELDLDDKWKTYWSNPGDGGIPMTIEVLDQKNVKDIEVFFPSPQRFVQYEIIETYGYDGKVVFPIIIKPKNSNEDVEITFKTVFAICKEICLFEEVIFSFDVKKNYREVELKEKYEQAYSLIPMKNENSEIRIEEIIIGKKMEYLEAKILSKKPARNLDIFIDGGSDLRFPKTTYNRSKNTILIPLENLSGKKINEDKEFTATLVFFNEESSSYKGAYKKFKLSDLKRSFSR